VKPAGENSYNLSDSKDIEGSITRIQYLIKDKDGVQKAANYYKTLLENVGFELTAFTKSNKPMDVAGRNWTLAAYIGLNYKEKSNIAGTKTSIDNRYFIAGKATKKNQQVFFAMIINEFDKSEVYIQVDVIGPDIELEKQDVVSAETIAKEINEFGHTTIYGIYFDIDKAEIKEGSEPALEEIAKYLKNNMGAVLYVVGHTSLVGNIDFQVALSKSRADAVIKALMNRYLIGSERLIAQGVGPFSPVATNQNVQGRERNQRIELVLKNF
jgi:outer membrane protein OmpA-like peptidoglycan-associated protein